MIRFIDLGKQIAIDENDPEWSRQFVFFNTTITAEFANRIISLMPEWATVIEVKNPRSCCKVEGIEGKES